MVGSAIAGFDYLRLDNAQIIIPAGSSVDAIACINISIIDDDEFEQEEVLMVEWTPDHDNTLSFGITTFRTMIDITITDNDGKSCVQKNRHTKSIQLLFLLVVATISVPSEVSVSEGDGTVEVCATLSGVFAIDPPIISITLITTPGI